MVPGAILLGTALVMTLSRQVQVMTRFILIQTSHNGNVGAAARAMKTMGFEELVLVEPKDPKVLRRDKTKHGASGALDILESAKVVNSLHEALEGGFDQYVCATGMAHSMQFERPQQQYRAPRQYFEKVVKEVEQPLRIAFLFGNERYGMRPEDIDVCQVVLGIPTNPQFGSLNLASAVQLIAYDWREAIGGYSMEDQEQPTIRSTEEQQ